MDAVTARGAASRQMTTVSDGKSEHQQSSVLACQQLHEGRQLKMTRMNLKEKQGQCLAMGMWFSEREKNLFAGHLGRDFLSSRA